MIERLTSRLTAKLISAGAQADKRPIYAYGIECVLSTTIIFLLLILSGIVMGKLLDMLICIAFWIPLRMLVGGFHANSHLLCTIISVSLGIGMVAISPYISYLNWFVTIPILVICYAAIFILAPVLHANHPLSQARIIKSRFHARIYGGIELAVIIALYFMHKPLFCCAAIAYFVTVGCALIGKMQSNSKEK